MTHICAVITNTEDIERARSLGCTAFEFRLDMFEEPVTDLSFVSQPELTIVTIRSTEDEARQEMFVRALAAGADFVDIESDSALRGAFPGKTVCSYHDFEKTPDAAEIVALFRDLEETGIPKAAFMVRGPKDLLAIADAAAELRSRGRPFIIIGMGDAGKVTRIRADMLGSLVSYCAVSEKSGSAPGQLTVAEAAGLGSDAKLCGVIGFPLTRTFSPAIHTAAFSAAGIRGVYVKIPTPEDEVSLIPEMMRVYDFEGLNVTIPHKQAIMSFLHGLTPAAEKISAVNTITRDLTGDNTDWLGVAATLDRFDPAGKKVLLWEQAGQHLLRHFTSKNAGQSSRFRTGPKRRQKILPPGSAERLLRSPVSVRSMILCSTRPRSVRLTLPPLSVRAVWSWIWFTLTLRCFRPPAVWVLRSSAERRC